MEFRNHTGTTSGRRLFHIRGLDRLANAPLPASLLEPRVSEVRFGGTTDDTGFQSTYDVSIHAADTSYEFDVIATPAVRAPRTESLGIQRYRAWAEGMGRLRYTEFPTYLARLTETIECAFLTPSDLMPPFITYRPAKNRLSPFAPVGPWVLTLPTGPFDETLRAQLSIENHRVRTLYASKKDTSFEATPFSAHDAVPPSQLVVRLRSLTKGTPNLSNAYLGLYG